MARASKVLTPRNVNYSQWYNDLVLQAGLAEHSPVRGCMIIKPLGCALWENMRADLDKRFRETGHTNAYFPLFIPKSFLNKEAAHVEGFAKECAVVTHYRLVADPATGELIVDPSAKLEEELIVRPTSETIIWNTYKDWIQSYRDLPLLINQWANVVRWEMRTRLFLRTAEFLWQEGHTAHATQEEALEETRQMLEVYTAFAQETLAIPVIGGTKTPAERFAGAVETFTIEALMQDGKALQAGTSHFLGQNFAKAFDVKFLTSAGTLEYVWATSWGVSTRLIGALIMTHSDDAGLILPPRIAPIQVVVIPVAGSEADQGRFREYTDHLRARLDAQNITCHVDDDDQHTPGWKFAEYELRGVPLRIVVGPREITNGAAEITRRDSGEKRSFPIEGIERHVRELLESIQKSLFDRASIFQKEHTYRIDNLKILREVLEDGGGFVLAHWDGTARTESQLRELTKASIRCIPLEQSPEKGACILSGEKSAGRVLIARSY